MNLTGIAIGAFIFGVIYMIGCVWYFVHDEEV